MKNYMGKCEYCGNEYGIMAKTQAEADAEAEKQCDCRGARVAEKKRKLSEELELFIGEKADALNFAQVKPAIHDAIKVIGGMIVEDLIESATFRVDGTTITIKAGKKTKVTRKYTYEQTGEVE